MHHTQQATVRFDDGTVDREEVEFYAGLADRWWDRSGPFWPLHRLNELRVEYLQTKLASPTVQNPPLAGMRIVDIGCGGGILAESMAKLGAELSAIDVVEKNIEAARYHSKKQGLDIDYRLATASALVDAGETFDVVLNMEVVEHVADLPAFIADCAKLVRPGGLMVVATINRNWLSYLCAIVAAEYVLGWLPRGTHKWAQFRTPAELALLLAANGLTIEDKVGVKVNPFTREFSITRLDWVNFMLTARKPLLPN